MPVTKENKVGSPIQSAVDRGLSTVVYPHSAQRIKTCE